MSTLSTQSKPDAIDDFDETEIAERRTPRGAKIRTEGIESPVPPVERKPAPRPFYRRPIFLVLMLILAAGIFFAVRYEMVARHYESTDDAFIEGHVIPISPEISARVSAVYVGDNTFVHKRDLLVALDPVDYQAALDQVRGAEAAARGKLQQARSQVIAANAAREEAVAGVDVATVNADNMALDLKRYEGLDERARSKQQLDNAVAAQKTAQAQVEQARAKLASAESQIVTAQASVTAAEGDLSKASADVHRADVNLGYCRITATEDGRITRKSVESGSYVSAGQALFALVPSDVWVVANFKETQLGSMRPGQGVNIHVDAFPEKVFTGKVDSIQAGTGSRFSMLPAENATGNFVKVVQRVPVKIVLDPGQTNDSARILAPGMSVEPSVKVR